jgi:hypothetical protein
VNANVNASGKNYIYFNLEMTGMRIRKLKSRGGGGGCYVQDLETTDLEYIPW